ncbi:MAG: PH domain-containing protein [Luteibaculaceae bacterium]
MVKRYYSSVSYTMLALIGVVLFIPVLFLSGMELRSTAAIISLVFQLLIFSFAFHLFHNTIYTIENSTLKVKCGFIKYAPIEVHSITSITKTNSWVSSPAASFDRILIKHRKYDELILSPKHKEDFIKSLQTINPNIEVRL